MLHRHREEHTQGGAHDTKFQIAATKRYHLSPAPGDPGKWGASGTRIHINGIFLFENVCVCCLCVCTTCRSRFSPCTTWVSGTELKSSALVASAISCWAIPTASVRLPEVVLGLTGQPLLPQPQLRSVSWESVGTMAKCGKLLKCPYVPTG